MPRESAESKGQRYLIENRLLVERIDPDARVIVATVRGSGEVYSVGWDRDRSWHCSCPAMRATCSHLAALKAVTVRPPSKAERKAAA